MLLYLVRCVKPVIAPCLFTAPARRCNTPHGLPRGLPPAAQAHRCLFIALAVGGCDRISHRRSPRSFQRLPFFRAETITCHIVATSLLFHRLHLSTPARNCLPSRAMLNSRSSAGMFPPPPTSHAFLTGIPPYSHSNCFPFYPSTTPPPPLPTATNSWTLPVVVSRAVRGDAGRDVSLNHRTRANDGRATDRNANTGKHASLTYPNAYTCRTATAHAISSTATTRAQRAKCLSPYGLDEQLLDWDGLKPGVNSGMDIGALSWNRLQHLYSLAEQ